MHDYDEYERILGDAGETTLEVLRTLGLLLGAGESETASQKAWAARRLGVPQSGLVAVDHVASMTGIAVLGHVLGDRMQRHGVTEVGGPGDGEPPTWAPLQIGTVAEHMVPARLVAFFPPGSLAQVPLCLAIDNASYARELKVYSRTEDRPHAQDVMHELLALAKGELNPYRSRVLEATFAEHMLLLSVSAAEPVDRSTLVLPESLWREVDVFVDAATSKRDLMRSLGLGTTRGMLLAGPPGVGKTHLARVLASELQGEFTVIFADAATMRSAIRDVYDEGETFGPLVVILEDVDLIIGHRKKGSNPEALADFLGALDGIKQLSDVFTIATTNDPGAIDPAAQRTARFDTILTLPRPGVAERVAILERYLDPLGLDLDLGATARLLEGCMGSDLREVARRAVLELGTSFDERALRDVATSGRWKPQADVGQYL
ncbi:AAA family ATPase [Oerskovia jenensis]|uniref:AAA+ ATPase domain-containing protein n=1 Tax=Oerskovia jenensis TaxID=162169 RepID=A0ABS2LI34_9CELL|nr:ATP-binding protein [Oerskovia jenensis]MBM7479794.1 hypothetical protein [Oerskovia jenensis]